MAYEFKPLCLMSPLDRTPELDEAERSFLTTHWSGKHVLPEDEILCHYTNLEGMLGILESRAIWLGHASSFNDPNEIQFGQNVVRDVLRDMMARESSEDIRSFLQEILTYVDAFWTDITGSPVHHIFIACFSEFPNSLSLWRAYANQGDGYCLELCFSEDVRFAPEHTALDPPKSVLLRKVIYDPDDQGSLVKKYLAQVTAGARSAFEGSYTDDRSAQAAVMAIQAMNVLLDMMICFKNPAFREENEWRLIRATRYNYEPETLRFRQAGVGLIPYRPTFVLDKQESGDRLFPLSSITLGPSLEPVRAHSAIRLLLHHIASSDHPVKIDPNVSIREAGYKLR